MGDTMSERGITGARACQQWEVIQKSFERISRGGVFKTRNGEMAKWRNDEIAK